MWKVESHVHINVTGDINADATNFSIFPDAEGLNFAHWMIFNVPLMLINGFLAWVWLQVLFLGLFRYNLFRKIRKRKKKLGIVLREEEKLEIVESFKKYLYVKNNKLGRRNS